MDIVKDVTAESNSAKIEQNIEKTIEKTIETAAHKTLDLAGQRKDKAKKCLKDPHHVFLVLLLLFTLL